MKKITPLNFDWVAIFRKMLPVKKPVSSVEKTVPQIPDISGMTELLKKIIIQDQQMLQALNKISKQNEKLLYQIKAIRKELDQKSLIPSTTSVFGTLAKSLFSPIRSLFGIFSDVLQTIVGIKLLTSSRGILKAKVPNITRSMFGPFRGLGSVLSKLGLIGATVFTLPKIVEGYQMAQDKGVSGIGAISRGIDYGILNTLTLGLLPPELNYMIVDLFNELKAKLLSAIWTGISNLFKTLVRKITESMSNIFKEISAFIITSIDQLTQPIRTKLSEIINAVGKPIANFLDKTTDPLKPLFEKLSEWWKRQNQVIQRPPRNITPPANQIFRLEEFIPGIRDTFSIPDKIYNRLKDGGGESIRAASIQLPEGFITIYQNWKNTKDPVMRANLQNQMQKQYPDIYKRVFSNTALLSGTMNDTTPPLMNIRPGVLNVLKRLYMNNPTPNPFAYKSELESLNEFQSFLMRILPPSQRYEITQLARDNPGRLGYGIYGHLGTDIAVPTGTLLRSPMSGYVILRETTGGWGKHAIIINGQAGIILGHLSQFDPYLVKKIQSGSNIVHPGEAIGLTGNTGNSTGPHLDVTVFKMIPKGTQPGEYQIKYLQSYKEIVDTLRQATVNFDYRLTEEMAKKFNLRDSVVASIPISDLVIPSKTITSGINFPGTDPFVSLPFDLVQMPISTQADLISSFIMTLNRLYPTRSDSTPPTESNRNTPTTKTITNKSITPSRSVAVNVIPLKEKFDYDTPATGIFQINYQRMIGSNKSTGGIDWGAIFNQTKDRIKQDISNALSGALDQVKSGAVEQVKLGVKSLPIINQIPEPILNLAEQKISSIMQTGNIELYPSEVFDITKSLFPQTESLFSRVEEVLSKPITIPLFNPRASSAMPGSSEIPIKTDTTYDMTPNLMENNELKSMMFEEQISTLPNQKASSSQNAQPSIATPTVAPIPIPAAPVNIIASNNQSPLDDILILLNTVFRT